jgi:xanthine dehydrogenase YagR molybdenum-binding subunit
MSQQDQDADAPVGVATEDWTPNDGPDPLIRRTKHGLIGTPVSRLDGVFKVAGEARFAAEFVPEGMLYAALAYSTIAVGRIADIDTSAAEAAPGVALVMTYRNAPRMPAPALFMTQPKGVAGSNLPVMQDDSIHWNGEPIAVVLADTQEQANHAASAVRATYESQPPQTLDEAKADLEVPGNLAGEPPELEIGDAEAALAAAPHSVDQRYSTPRHNHNAIELHAVTLAWDGDDLHLHDASQSVTGTAWTIAQCFGIDETQVHVTSPYVGGGFGGKTLWSHHILAAAAARLAQRPVRLTLSREGVYRIVGWRSPTEQRVAIGAQADGRFDAIIHTGISVRTAHNALAEPFSLPARHLYATGSLKVAQRIAKQPTVANTFMRAPGEAVGSFGLESAIDELAELLDMDPVELRLRNEPQSDPATGEPFSQRNLVKAYRDGAERFGWAERPERPGSRRDGEWLIGMGCATALFPYFRFGGAAARITLNRVGHATVEVPALEMGMGTVTTQSLITADRLGLPLERVTVSHGDSAFPGVVLAGGSAQTATVAGAIIAAHHSLVTELLTLVDGDSPLAGLTVEEIGSRDGGLCELADPRRWESYTSLLERGGRDELTVVTTAADPTEREARSMNSHGAVFCEVRVNAITGETLVARVVGSYDCGRILNPKTALSQFRGGIIMGLGLALMEETEFDERTARIMNPSLSEYHVPVHMDVPRIEVIWTDIPDPYTPMGARGIGEIGIVGVGAAVANAVYNATGRRVRDLPITLDKLL